MQGISAAKAENTSEYRKMPAAGQPGEERRGEAWPASAREGSV